MINHGQTALVKLQWYIHCSSEFNNFGLIKFFALNCQQKGKKRQYELGKYLRKRYYNLLGDGRYSPDKVYVESSNVDRALVSAAANLAGMFPPEKDQIWTDELQWLPIPIHTKPQKLDYTLAAEAPCPRYDRALNDLLESMEQNVEHGEMREIFNRIQLLSGLKNASLFGMFGVFDSSIVAKTENRTLVPIFIFHKNI